jgi:uncharacterized coiled-coil protein SlyX
MKTLDQMTKAELIEHCHRLVREIDVTDERVDRLSDTVRKQDAEMNSLNTDLNHMNKRFQDKQNEAHRLISTVAALKAALKVLL